MPAPFDFPTATPSAKLPLLFAGQAQKEFFVNQALSVIDAMLPRSVVASASTPPPDAAEGSVYRITAPAAGDWIGEEDALALRIGGSWLFASAQEGMQIFDRAADRLLVFRPGWESANAPAAPTGGSVIDVEARAAITQLVDALTRLGIVG
jgi:hypothetical protein